MLRKWKNTFGLLAGLLAASFLLTACPNGTGKEGCPEGEIENEDGECVPAPQVCELWEPDCCIRTRNSGDMRGIQDCFQLSTSTHMAVCETSTGTCYLECSRSSDCLEWEAYADRCGDGDCVCDDGLCLLPACSAHADCGGAGLCIAGACVPGVDDPDGCVIAPSPVYLSEGATVALHVYATKDGEYVVPAGDFSFDSDDDSIASVDADTGVVTGGAGEGQTSINASVAGATCSVSVTNLEDVSAGEVRVLVLDEVNRMPVEAATVVIDDNGEEEPHDVVTDVWGVAHLTEADISGAFDVHVFAGESADAPDGYNYVSAIGVTERDLVFYLPRNAASAAGGIKGTLTREDFAHISEDTVHVALSGLSIPGNLIDLDLELLIGEMIDTNVEFANQEAEIPLPSGLALGIDHQFFKDWYAPTGVPGLRTGWMLGGNFSLPEVLQLAGPFLDGGADVEDVEIGPLLGAILPMFDRFYSAVKPGIDVTACADPLPDHGAWPGELDDACFPDTSLALASPLSLKGIVNVPTLPELDGAYMDGAIVLGGVMVEGQGLVPLGLTAGVDTDNPENNPPDGRVNDTEPSDDPAVGEGQLAIRLAPQHGGVEGSRYAILSLALDFDGLADDEGRYPLSGMVHTFDRLQFEEEVSFSLSSFLGLAEDASYDRTSRVFTPAPVANADLYRAQIAVAGGRGWVVYHDGTTPIHLIDPAQHGHQDRASIYMNAQAVATRDGIGVDDVFGFNATNLDSLIDYVLGFSTIGVLAE